MPGLNSEPVMASRSALPRSLRASLVDWDHIEPMPSKSALPSGFFFSCCACRRRDTSRTRRSRPRRASISGTPCEMRTSRRRRGTRFRQRLSRRQPSRALGARRVAIARHAPSRTLSRSVAGTRRRRARCPARSTSARLGDDRRRIRPSRPSTSGRPSTPGRPQGRHEETSCAASLHSGPTIVLTPLRVTTLCKTYNTRCHASKKHCSHPASVLPLVKTCGTQSCESCRTDPRIRRATSAVPRTGASRRTVRESRDAAKLEPHAKNRRKPTYSYAFSSKDDVALPSTPPMMSRMGAASLRLTRPRVLWTDRRHPSSCASRRPP